MFSPDSMVKIGFPWRKTAGQVEALSQNPQADGLALATEAVMTGICLNDAHNLL